MAFCTHCGAKLKDNSRFCPACGAETIAAGASGQKPGGKRPKAGRSAPGARKASAAMAAPPDLPGASPEVPDKLVPLIGYIISRTISAFFRQLPTTIAFGLAAWVFHTYLLVVVNEGFNMGSLTGRFLALQGQTISGSLLWMVGTMILTGLWRRMRGKGPRVSLSDRIAAMRAYLTEAPMDAYSVIAGGVGIALSIATFTNSSSSLVLAVGFGALIASKAGSVFSLLFKTAWNTLFSTVRRSQVRKYGMAAGYMAVAASSLGMLANSMVPIGGVIPGVALLGAAVFLGMRSRSEEMAGLFLLAGLGTWWALFGPADLVFADDGGWQESGGTLTGWINSQGAIPAIIYGVGPAIGTGLGVVLGGVLSDIGGQIPEFDDGNGGDDDEGSQGEGVPPTIHDPDLVDPETGERLIVHDGQSYEGGKAGQVWYDGKWVDRDDAISRIGQYEKDHPLYDPRTGDSLIVNDGKTYEGGKPGQVWFDGKWMDRSEAQHHLDKVNAELERESQRIREEQRQWSDEQRRIREDKLRSDGYVFDKEQNAWVQGPGYKPTPSASDLLRKAEEDREQRILKSADKVSDRVSGELREHIEELRNGGKYEELAEVCRDYWRGQVREGQEESTSQQRWATAYGIGEMGAKATVAASRGALMVLGGPAGAAATAISVGAVSAAGEGAEKWVEGGSALDVAKSTAAGFLSGAKDGAIGHFTNLPGTSGAVKVLVPAAADTAETFIRTGDIKRSLATGAVSAAGDMIGLGTDALPGGLKKELIGAATSAASGGTLSVINGGDFGEGAIDGLVNHVGGKVGSSVGTSAVNRYDAQAESTVQQAQAEVSGQRRQTVLTDDQAENVLAGLRADRDDPNTSPADRQMIDEHIASIENGPRQSERINELDRSRIQRDQNGDPIVDSDGHPVKSDKVDTRGALDQLQDTRSSRTAKQADPELRDAIVKTRTEEIYAPADQRTINRAGDNPEVQKMMQPGDKLAMDTFSTPGKPPSLGADRDARLVIERDTGRVDSKGNPIIDKIEVPRKHWESDAYKDFYDHSMDIVGGRENVTPDSHPEFFRRREELDYMKGSGMSQAEIDARAWGEAHNQLFTDKYHVEASAANSDQALRNAEGRMTSNVQEVQAGRGGQLTDQEGYARMWGEKSRFYEHNTPEAVAQSQKGIEAQLQVREGLRAQGYRVPELPPDTTRAMELISRAPVGVDATPEAMARLNSDLQGLGYRDTNDAMQKIASQTEALKWSQKQGLTTGGVISTARGALGPQEPNDE
ncbi:hypothetical protein CSC94_01165 [Zhengella mangrovi]|uniref:Zinc-ribbon domain-containing protein n=1 Tax=Zhengella mangrovi TaxID=1982044 RepID=A0A2G1QT33_9HYPH|nr:zinc-ribbon domain-containing protein [Zhengella mangrovi]PHP68641.1 hypothetical protein CSC94_01165 [Zhengella mangrovi]